MKIFKICFLASLILMVFSLVFADREPASHQILKVDIDGPITPATEDLLQDSLSRAHDEDFIALLIRLDTPGGLVESMRNMVKDMLASDLPVIVWVDPPGARATSAGVFLVAASDHAVMSPQTTIGSASPVTMGGEEQDETMQSKIINEMLSLVRTVAKDRDRNVDWYEKAVTEAANIDAEEALQLRVIDHIATSTDDLLSQLGKKGLQVYGEEITFESDEISIVQFEPGIKYRILSWLLHPQIAYLLFLAGMAGLFFELSNPGAVFPGVIGSMCLIMGLYSLAVLPTNIAGILLLILGFIFIILEINMPTFGLLSAAALASFFFGSLFLFDAEHPYFQIPTMTIIPVVLILTAILLALTYLVGKSQMAPKTHQTGLPDSTAKVVNWSGTHGQVKVRGEIWRAQSQEMHTLQPGQEVHVEKVEGLTLHIKPV